jgi:hypothetical protein
MVCFKTDKRTAWISSEHIVSQELVGSAPTVVGQAWPVRLTIKEPAAERLCPELIARN